MANGQKDYSFHYPPFNRFGYSIFVDRCGDILCGGLYFVAGIAHGDTDAGVAQHGNIVASIAKSNGVFQTDAEMADNFVNAPLFGVALGCDIGKGGMPAPYLAMRDVRGYFLFFGFVDMDILTLVLMIAASVIGSFVMADIVTKFDRKKVRYALFIGLFILATVILMKVMAIGPFGTVGTELGLRGVKLVIAVVGNFVFGALMSIGVGLYAPCMAMVLALGMDAGCAFPAMMGSCAYLMAFGNGPKFIAQGRYDMVACWTQAIFGAIGVYCAYAFVSSLPLETLTKVIAVIVYITAFLYLHDAIKKGSAA